MQLNRPTPSRPNFTKPVIHHPYKKSPTRKARVRDKNESTFYDLTWNQKPVFPTPLRIRLLQRRFLPRSRRGHIRLLPLRWRRRSRIRRRRRRHPAFRIWLLNQRLHHFLRPAGIVIRVPRLVVLIQRPLSLP